MAELRGWGRRRINLFWGGVEGRWKGIGRVQVGLESGWCA